MRKLLIGLGATSILSAPVHAAAWQGPINSRPGAFVGAKLQVPLGQAKGARPHAALTVAPTQSRISADGMVRTRIGEGVALNLTPDSKPTLTLAGVRADALLVQRGDQASGDDKLGVSTAGWIAIGVGTVLVVGGVALALLVDAVNDNSE